MCCESQKRNNVDRKKDFFSYDLAMESNRLKNIPPTLKELAMAKRVPRISTYTDEYCKKAPDITKVQKKCIHIHNYI